MVPSEIGILPEYRGVTGTPPGDNGPIWALREKRRGGQGRPRAPSPPSPNRTRKGGGGAPFFLSPSLPPSPTRQGRGVLLPVGVVLGNVVISKNFLRTRKIMVMHSNEGESVVYIPL